MITVNGKELELKEPLTLEVFLTESHYNLKRVAVEMNGEIVPKNVYATTLLHNGDKLEVVSFVGGG